MSKQAVLNVLYPKEAASDFDMDYYLHKHMPLVQKLWAPFGLKSWSVATTGEESGFYLQAVLIFESPEALEKMPTDEVFGDVKNFTSITPQKWVGSLQAQVTVN
ncbi:hypothetical protein SLS62_007818 [Diatrype stigma]|uniref:Ethyl tert-butyl ether degradation EthD n=1 Tax=Diatrype stigma TaxID=117547 RepID=A0AAN9UNP9_9PEZI